jgi:hypothetical protein
MVSTLAAGPATALEDPFLVDVRVAVARPRPLPQEFIVDENQ